MNLTCQVYYPIVYTHFITEQENIRATQARSELIMCLKERDQMEYELFLRQGGTLKELYTRALKTQLDEQARDFPLWACPKCHIELCENCRAIETEDILVVADDSPF